MQTADDLATNLRRLMARRGMTFDDVVACSGLDERTIRGMLAGQKKPHARTLYRLARGLEVDVDQLFQDRGLLARHQFDRDTNPVVDEFITNHPALFGGWNGADFHELFSRFGAGGSLNDEGARQAAEQVNRRREVQRKVALVLESEQSDVLAAMVDALFNKVVIRTASDARPAQDKTPCTSPELARV